MRNDDGRVRHCAGATPGQFGDYLKQQIDKYAKLVREIQLQVD